MRLGLFGGSFDPVHNGHLSLAKACLEQAKLDQIWFVPTAVQPLKPNGPVASNEDRVAMLRLALSGEPALVPSTLEIDRGGVSYTVDTLRELTRQRPQDDWFLLMGADALRDLPRWRQPGEILQMATLLVVHRPGEDEIDFSLLSPLVTKVGWSVVDMPAVDISSSQIRGNLARGESIHGLVPQAVEEYLAHRDAYPRH